MPTALDGIQTCISGIRAHSASDYTTTAGTPPVSRNKHFTLTRQLDRETIMHVCVCVCVCARLFTVNVLAMPACTKPVLTTFSFHCSSHSVTDPTTFTTRRQVTTLALSSSTALQRKRLKSETCQYHFSLLLPLLSFSLSFSLFLFLSLSLPPPPPSLSLCLSPSIQRVPHLPFVRMYLSYSRAASSHQLQCLIPRLLLHFAVAFTFTDTLLLTSDDCFAFTRSIASSRWKTNTENISVFFRS